MRHWPRLGFTRFLSAEMCPIVNFLLIKPALSYLGLNWGVDTRVRLPSHNLWKQILAYSHCIFYFLVETSKARLNFRYAVSRTFFRKTTAQHQKNQPYKNAYFGPLFQKLVPCKMTNRTTQKRGMLSVDPTTSFFSVWNVRQEKTKNRFLFQNCNNTVA